MLKNYCLKKGVNIDSEEEKQNFKIIFFFRNAKNPESEVENFITYNILSEWGHGKYNTHEKRLICACKNWKIREGNRIDGALLEFLRRLYTWGCENKIKGLECLLNSRISGESKEDGYHIRCSDEVGKWLDDNKEYVRYTRREVLKVDCIFYDFYD